MGFGWMFLGYLLLLGTNFVFLDVPVDITPDILGFLLMTHGFTVASRYCECFRTTRILGLIGIPSSAVVMLLNIALSLKWISLPAAVATAADVIYSLFMLTFTISLVWSLYLISAQTEVERLRKRAIRCVVYTVIFFALESSMDSIVAWSRVSLSAAQIGSLKMLAGAIYVILNAALIFSCYMWICLEGDEDMPDNRKHKYKTPFDYFDRAKSSDLDRKQNKTRK